MAFANASEAIHDCEQSLATNANKAQRSEATYHCLLDKLSCLHQAPRIYCQVIATVRRTHRGSLLEFALPFIMATHRVVLCCQTKGLPETNFETNSRDSHVVVYASRTAWSHLRSPKNGLKYVCRGWRPLPRLLP